MSLFLKSAILPLLVLLLGLGAAPATAQSSKIGFIDVERVILSYEKTAELTNQLEARLTEEEKKIKAQVAAINEDLRKLKEEEEVDIEDRVAMLARFQKERDLAERKAKVEVQRTLVLAQLEQDLVNHMKKVYEELVRTTEVVARARGLEVVLMVRGKKGVEGASREAVKTNILVRSVVWHEEALDITDAVLESLN